MVRGSELAFRMLVRQHNIRLCYTPMMRSDVLARSHNREAEEAVLEYSESDSPLIAQLCGRNPDILATAAQLVLQRLPHISALDLNLGCPQPCAEMGRWGAYLAEEPELAAACVRSLVAAVPIPVFVKIRRFECLERTIAFARLLHAAGASAIAIHCRLRSAKHDGPPEYAVHV
jgi:tRNA-dihydrouridine synthase